MGAGTGMVCFGWKGGIGTASRRVGEHVVGALVLANFGVRARSALRRDPGRPRAARPGDAPPPAGSCIAVLATDLPLDGAQLERLARRAGLGLARTGSVAHHGSGEIFLAFSVAGRRPRGQGATAPGHPEAGLDDVFTAAVEATEAAVLNCLWAAPDVTGRNGRSTPGLPHEPVLELLRRAGPNLGS